MKQPHRSEEDEGAVRRAFQSSRAVVCGTDPPFCIGVGAANENGAAAAEEEEEDAESEGGVGEGSRVGCDEDLFELLFAAAAAMLLDFVGCKYDTEVVRRDFGVCDAEPAEPEPEEKEKESFFSSSPDAEEGVDTLLPPAPFRASSAPAVAAENVMRRLKPDSPLLLRTRTPLAAASSLLLPSTLAAASFKSLASSMRTDFLSDTDGDAAGVAFVLSSLRILPTSELRRDLDDATPISRSCDARRAARADTASVIVI